MNLRDLKYFISVAKHQHFGKAAEESYVSQPALSMQLKKLEEELGVQLFERTNKSVQITAVGEDILAYAKNIVKMSEDIQSIAKTHHDPFAGEIKLGAFPTLAPYFLPHIVPIVSKKFQNLKLLLVEEKTDNLLESLNEGKIDGAFLALPIDDEGLECTPLLEDEFLLAVSPYHHYAKLKSIEVEDLKDDCLLLLEEGHCLRDQALDICSKTGACENQNFRATSLETLRQMVAANVGITLIPQMAMKHNDGLVYIPFGKNKPTRKIGLVWRKKSSRIKALTEIVKSIQGSFES
ncbi:MAG: LysR substrate-binding domain-containing protein [Pseudomonadota bacterium]|nr:LysR substrate-binding domain-containing protein [Pseudomonadota bacterium]